MLLHLFFFHGFPSFLHGFHLFLLGFPSFFHRSPSFGRPFLGAGPEDLPRHRRPGSRGCAADPTHQRPAAGGGALGAEPRGPQGLPGPRGCLGGPPSGLPARGAAKVSLPQLGGQERAGLGAVRLLYGHTAVSESGEASKLHGDIDFLYQFSYFGAFLMHV